MRLGDLDALKEYFKTAFWQESQEIYLQKSLSIIDKAPTVPLPDFKEGYKQAIIDGKTNFSRPQGEWIIVKDKKYGDNVKCPFCGKEIAGSELYFCCKCGADMRKGSAE